MVEWIVSSSVLIAVVILLRFVLKGKLSLRLQYALWAVVLARLLVPVSIGDTAMSVSNLTQKAAASEPAQFMSALSETELPRMTYQAAYNEVAKEYADRGIQIEDMPLEEYAETVDYEIMNKMNGDLSIAEVVKIIWVCGIALVGLWFLFSNLRLHRSLKRSRTLLTDNHALPVYLSNAIDTPCLFGLFHPAIYLTSEAIESEHTQHHAVEHELTHFRHKDNIWAILRSVCLAVHWFNPLVWCAAVLSRNDAELACDESTILRLGEEERASYGRTLIHLTCEKHPALLNTATTMTGSGKSIKERISLIVKKPKMALYTAIAVIVIAAVAVGCTFTGAKDQPASFEEWTSSLTGEAIEWAETAKGYGIEEISYTIPKSDFDNLSTLLGTITDENCFRKKPEADDENGYRLALYRDDKLWLFKCLADGSIGLMFNDPETGAYYGSEGSLLIIEYPELWNYIVDTVDQKGISDTTMPIDVTAIDVNTVPGAVIDYARNYIQQQIDYHNELGNNPPEGSSNYNITAAKITGLEQINTGTAGLNDGVALYRLEYRLLADHPENIVMAGGMSVESGWLTEWNSTGQPYLLLHYDDSSSETVWTPICVTNTDVIGVDYGTPEMLEKYGNSYTAAAMELWGEYQRTKGDESTNELAMIQALLDATMENSSLTRIERNNEVDLVRSGATMDVLQSAAENLQVLSDPMAFDSYASAAYLWLGEPGDRHISFFAGKEPYQVMLRYVGDDINEAAVTNNPQLYLYLIAAAEMQNVELHDLDGDGVLEGIVWPFPMERRNIIIYDVFDGALQRIDVNETMDCAASDFTGLIANIHPDYNCMVQIVNDSGQVNIYKYRDGEFSYIRPLNDVIGGRSPGTPLTAEQIEKAKEALSSVIYDRQDNIIGVNPISCFFTSYYDDVRELDFEEFLAYFTGDGSTVDEEEFAALKELDNFLFRGEVSTLSDMPVPVHRYPRRLVDMVLKEYAGITTEDLDTSGVEYLPEYDAFYNYTSDFGPGTFTCTRGEIMDNIVRLYDEASPLGTDILTLRKDGEAYRIVSYQFVEA